MKIINKKIGNIHSRCSNCNTENEYTLKDWEGREITACKKCLRPLSICHFFPEVNNDTIQELEALETNL